MIHEEDGAAVEEAPAVVDEADGFEDVYGEAPEVDDYEISSRPVVSGGS